MLKKVPARVGHALRHRRAGLEAVAIHRLNLSESLGTFEVRSPAFMDGDRMPVKYTADGPGLSPPLFWQGIPANASSTVLLVEDADSPTPQPLVHAIVFELKGQSGCLAEGALNSPDHRGDGVAAGRNSFLHQGWLPPDPPPGHGSHRYVFEMFALKDGRALSHSPGRKELLNAVFDRAIAANYLIGTYERAA